MSNQRNNSDLTTDGAPMITEEINGMMIHFSTNKEKTIIGVDLCAIGGEIAEHVQVIKV
jgi:hypothetical protein